MFSPRNIQVVASRRAGTGVPSCKFLELRPAKTVNVMWNILFTGMF